MSVPLGTRMHAFRACVGHTSTRAILVSGVIFPRQQATSLGLTVVIGSPPVPAWSDASVAITHSCLSTLDMFLLHR